MDEFFTIFTESTEDMGLMYKSYEPLLDVVDDFIYTVSKCCDQVVNKPFDVEIDLSKKISDFKQSIKREFKPQPIVISDTPKLINTVKDFIKKLDDVLQKYIRLKNNVSFGGNYYRAVIRRPAVYSKDIDEDKYAKVNNNIRNVDRALDWIEKAIIDLYNMADQDLNILTIVNKVYNKNHIYEASELPAGVVEEDIADSVMPMLPGARAGVTQPKDEAASWISNTRNKKTGRAPRYLSMNHDMADYIPGEGRDTDDEDPLDNYRRKPEPVDDDDDEPVRDTTVDDTEDKPTEKEKQQAVQNYYYYTYNNSLNKNTGSFNKDSSTHDDHSKRTDDHSTGKHINSHNNTSDKDEDDFHTVEATKPWELNIFNNNLFTEANTNDGRPESDHPIRDTMMDVDRSVGKVQQKVKKGVQDVVNVGHAAAKPFHRAKDWLDNMISTWRDVNETNVKDRMVDPYARKNLYSAIRKAIAVGALAKAGLLLNPFIIFLGVTRLATKGSRDRRIRNEVIGELKTEIEVTNEKIEDADRKGDYKAKYELMRFKNELNKKLMRVGGGEQWSGKRWGNNVI